MPMPAFATYTGGHDTLTRMPVLTSMILIRPLPIAVYLQTVTLTVLSENGRTGAVQSLTWTRGSFSDACTNPPL